MLYMGRFKLAIYALLAILAFWFLMSGTNKGRAIPEELVDVQAPAQSVSPAEVIQRSPLKTSPAVITINDPNDFRLLAVGQKFSIKTNTQNTQALVFLEVISSSVSSNFILITASSSPGSTSVITLTDSLTNILIKTANNIFEYSGSDFKGVVDQVRDLNLDDDIQFDEAEEPFILDDGSPELREERLES
jgi:hypothetical protein